MRHNDHGKEQRRSGGPGEAMASKQMALGAAVAAVIVAVAFYFWPAEEGGRGTSTDASTRVERAPTKPASAPAAPTSPNQ
jgi:hypothetical protein